MELTEVEILIILLSDAIQIIKVKTVFLISQQTNKLSDTLQNLPITIESEFQKNKTILSDPTNYLF